MLFACTACMMRAKDTIEQMTYLESAHKAGRLETFFAALDVLGAVPWKINKGVLEVVSELWNKGEEVADIPIKDPFNNIADPVKPEDYDTNPRSRADYKIAMRRVHKEKAQAHSTRCDTNYKLEIARAVSLEWKRLVVPCIVLADGTFQSSWTKIGSIFPIVSTSEAVPTQFHRTCHILGMTYVEVF